MSKEFEAAVKALKHAGDALRSAGDALISAGEAFSKIAEVIELRVDKVPAAEPEAAEDASKATDSPPITKADVKQLLSSKSREGYREEVKALLKKYGSENIKALKDSDLLPVYKEAEVIGNAG